MDILQNNLTKLDNLQSLCTNCGLCSEVCATYQESGFEHESPRGRINLARDFMNGSVLPNSKAFATFDNCLACQACEKMCPTAVSYQGIRTLVQEIRGSLKNKTEMLGNKKNYDKWIKAAGRLSSPFWRHYASTWMLFALGIKSPLAGSYLRKNGTSKLDSNKITLVISCSQDLFQHELIECAQKVLGKLNISYQLAKNQSCCGAIYNRLINGGLESVEYPQSQKFAAASQKALETGFFQWLTSTTVFLSQGCQSHMQSKTNLSLVGISSFILEHLQKNNIVLETKKQKTIYFQSYCRSNQKVESDPNYLLLKYIRGLNVEILGLSTACCGGYCGEIFLHPDNGCKLVQHKLCNVPKDSIIVVTSPDCHQAFFSQNQKGFYKIFHPMQIVAASLDLIYLKGN
jgi:glycolate oxidase iron-sulfur subunit